MNRRRCLAFLRHVAALALLAWPGLRAHAADTHALLIWVSDYGFADINLPGVLHDADRAHQIARRLGAVPGTLTELKEAQVTQIGVREALERLEQRVRPGDRVFVYFSGHGRRIDGRRLGSSGPCLEGLVMQDQSLFTDAALENALRRLTQRAAQVLMMNDSCHAGGAATKDAFGEPADDERVKALPAPPQEAASCGQFVNKGLPLGRDVARAAAPGRWLYLAAAAANEAAFSDLRGSRATRAWHRCLLEAPQEADLDHDGTITGRELQICAQKLVNTGTRKRQTLSFEGDDSVPVLVLNRRP